MENPQIFNDWCKELEDVDIEVPIDCWRILELNISNVCNLRCPFCPQSFGFKSLNKYMSFPIIDKVVDHLYNVNYKDGKSKFRGYVCLAGFGEPTLHPHFMSILHKLQDFKIELVTNGSYNDSIWETISQYYPNVRIKVSVHEWDKVEEYKERFKNCKRVVFRNHDMKNPNMNLYNRAGNVPIQQDEVVTRPCHYPFYKLMVDVDGSYLCCEADWTGSSKSNINVITTSIQEYYEQCLQENRQQMLREGGRQNITSNSCCNKCTINGTLCGQKFVDFYK